MRLYLINSKRVYLVIINDSKVLLLQNWYGDGGWSLPGGGVRKNETDQAALIREVEEELSLVLTKQDISLLDYQSPANRYNYRYYVAKSKFDHYKIDGREIVASKWADPSQLSANNTEEAILGAIRQSLSVA